MVDFDALILKRAQLQADMTAFEAEHAATLARHAELKNQWKQEDELLRAAARGEFMETGVVKLHPEISIGLSERRDYNLPGNIDWAISNAPHILDVDVEELVSHLAVPITIHFPVIGEPEESWPRTTITLAQAIAIVAENALLINNKRADDLAAEKTTPMTVVVTKLPIPKITKGLGAYLLSK